MPANLVAAAMDFIGGQYMNVKTNKDNSNKK